MQAIQAQLHATRQALTPVAGACAGLEARVLAAHAWGMTPEALVQHADELRDALALEQLVGRRLQHEPIAQIIGYKEFWRDVFVVSPAVLTPRADSETMLEALLCYRPVKDAPLRMLDLGTGSGCLLLSSLREYEQATGVGVDQSDAALAIASQNAQRLTLADRAAFTRSNWCSNLDGLFDVVLSNPPYIPTATIATLDMDVQSFEPHSALDGGTDGLDCYRSILQQVHPYLAPNALVFFEVGAGQAADVAALGVAHGFDVIEISADLAGIARIVVLQTR